VPRLGLGGGGLLMTIAMVSVLAAMAIPACQGGRQATVAVETYFYATQKIPATLAVAGAAAQPMDNASVELIAHRLEVRRAGHRRAAAAA
jgi:hypothetical protein